MILAFLLIISLVTYIDPVNISVTARQMMQALGFTQHHVGRVFSAGEMADSVFLILQNQQVKI